MQACHLFLGTGKMCAWISPGSLAGGLSTQRARSTTKCQMAKYLLAAEFSLEREDIRDPMKKTNKSWIAPLKEVVSKLELLL